MTEERLISQHIDSSPDDPANFRVRETGVHVWAFVGQVRAENGDVEEVARGYCVPNEAVEATLAYYRRNKAYIDARLLLNTA